MVQVKSGIKHTGILGGAFDPVHQGHVQLCDHVLDSGIVESIVCVPTYDAPHKQKAIAGFEQRVEMVDIALSANKKVSVSTIEKHLPEPSYSLHTIHALKQEISSETQLLFILGSDAFYDIRSWYNYIEVLQEVDLCVVPRNNASLQDIVGFSYELGFEKCAELNSKCLKRKGRHLFVLDVSPVGVSSTRVRQTLLAKSSLSDLHSLIPEQVRAYIAENNLYE